MKYRISSFVQFVLCFLVLAIATTLFLFTNKNYMKAEQRIINFDSENIDAAYLRISDVYDMDNQKTLGEFFDEEESLERMKQFSSAVKKEFNYLEYDQQSIVVRNGSNETFLYKDEFRVNYGQDDFKKYDKYGIPLHSTQLDKNAYNNFQLEEQVMTGRGFQPADFIYDNESPISALLGYEYEALVQLGDTVKFEYLNKEIEVKIIGFFKKDTSLIVSNITNFLDQQIVIPLLELEYTPLNEEEIYFQKILFSLKNCGYIKVKSGDDYYVYQNKLTEISSNLNLNYIVSDGEVYPYIKNISSTIGSIKGVFFISSVALFLILAASFAYIYLWNYNKNKKIYSIHLICGCSFLKLKLKIFSEILVQFILSLLVAGIINRFALGENSLYRSNQLLLEQSMMQTALFSLAVMLVICFVLNIYINNSNIYSSIRKEN